MKKYRLLYLLLMMVSIGATAQEPEYNDSLQAFRTRYINTHDVLSAEERTGLRFFPIQQEFNIPVRMEKIANSPWFWMSTSGTMKKEFRIYAILYGRLHDTSFQLQVYQSKKLMQDPAYANYLFIPFTDASNGATSYEVGRYIDLTTEELDQAGFQLDFNKAYNPSCAYISNKYNCPIPPKENNLPLYIRAGEMKFSKAH